MWKQVDDSRLLFAAAVLWLAVAGLSAGAGEPCPWKRSCDGASGTLLQWGDGSGSDGGPPSLHEPLATDRPTFTPATTTVGRGVAQIESGYTYTRSQRPAGDIVVHSLPETLLRYGALAEWLEFRVQGNYLDQSPVSGERPSSTSGAEDLLLGLKVALTPQAGLLPEMALVPQITVPTGGGEITAGETLGGVHWCYGWDVEGFGSIGGGTRVFRRLDDQTDEPYLEVAPSAVAFYDLSESITPFAEWYALFPSAAETEETEHYLQSGTVLLLTKGVQLDVRAGLGLNAAADDFFAGTGLAVRF